MSQAQQSGEQGPSSMDTDEILARQIHEEQQQEAMGPGGSGYMAPIQHDMGAGMIQIADDEDVYERGLDDFELFDEAAMKPGQRKEKILERVVDKDFFNGEDDNARDAARKTGGVVHFLLPRTWDVA